MFRIFNSLKWHNQLRNICMETSRQRSDLSLVNIMVEHPETINNGAARFFFSFRANSQFKEEQADWC